MTTPAQEDFALSWFAKRFEDFGRLRAKPDRTDKETALMKSIAALGRENLDKIPEPLKSQAFQIQLDDIWSESEAMNTAIANGVEPDLDVADQQISFSVIRKNIDKLTPGSGS